MSVFTLFTYNIDDPDRFSKYNPDSLEIVMSAIARHGGEVVFTGGSEVFQAGAKDVAVCIKFPSGEAVQAMMADPEYAAVAPHREESTSDYTIIVAPEFTPPA